MSTRRTDNRMGCLLSLLFLAGLFFIYNIISNNGEHCAYVYIYDPNKETELDLDLKVEIYENEVVQIFFDNGKYLDRSDFKGSTQLDSDGYASFKDNKGRHIGVILKSSDYCEY